MICKDSDVNTVVGADASAKCQICTSPSLNTTHVTFKPKSCRDLYKDAKIPIHSRQTQLRVATHIKTLSGCIQLHIQKSVQHTICITHTFHTIFYIHDLKMAQ